MNNAGRIYKSRALSCISKTRRYFDPSGIIWRFFAVYKASTERSNRGKSVSPVKIRRDAPDGDSETNPALLDIAFS